MPFISLFYPASDAAEHFVEGQHLEIAGPVFRTYAEAVSELAQEAPDVAEQGLPVEAYVLEVKPLRNGGGYSIVDAFEVSFGGMRGGARARNPREPKTVEMPELRGFKLGPDRELTLDEAAAVYGDFMAHNIPAGVPAGKVRRAFGAAATPSSVARQRKASAAIREEAAGKVASSLTRAVETHGVDGAKELVEDKLEAISAALDAGEITAPQAAPLIALETKKLQILDLLQRFCPPVGEEGAAAIYEVVRATLGGDEAAAEAGRVILEDVASRFTSAKVEVDDSAMPAPRKTRAKAGAGKAAAGKAAAAPGSAVFGDPTAFVKAYGSRIRGDAKLAKAIVANAVGLAPFPTGYPIAVLREATSDVYALLAEAGMVAEAPAVYSAPAQVAQFDDPGLQAIFGGLPVPPLPEQPEDYIIRQYSHKTGSPVYAMHADGRNFEYDEPDLRRAITVAEGYGVQTHTYYDTTLPGGGADFRPIEEAWAKTIPEPSVAMPVPEPPPAQVRSTGPRELSIAIDGIRGIAVPDGLLPSSAGYLKNEIAFGQLNIDESPAVFRRSNAEQERGNRNAWKVLLLPADTFANIQEWASSFYTPAVLEPEPPPMRIAAPPQNEMTRWQEIGRREVPGISRADAEDVGRSWEQVQRGILTQASFDAWVERLRREGRIQSVAAPAPLSAFEEAMRIVSLPFAEAERALETSAYGPRELSDALAARDRYTEDLALDALAVQARSQRPKLWEAIQDILRKKQEQGGIISGKLRFEYDQVRMMIDQASEAGADYTPAPEPAQISAEEQLAAKIAASNDAGLARLQAMLNG